MPDPKFEKVIARILSVVLTRKLRHLSAFPIFLLNSNIFSSLMESWCNVYVGYQFFSDKVNKIKVSESFLSSGNTRNFGAKTHIFHKPCTHIASIYTPLTYRQKSLTADRESLVFLMEKCRLPSSYLLESELSYTTNLEIVLILPNLNHLFSILDCFLPLISAFLP